MSTNFPRRAALTVDRRLQSASAVTRATNEARPLVLMRGAGEAPHFLMPEVAVTGEAHGHAAFIGGGDDIGIALAASWLDGGGGAGVGGGQQAVGEREERVTGDD